MTLGRAKCQEQKLLSLSVAMKISRKKNFPGLRRWIFSLISVDIVIT